MMWIFLIPFGMIVFGLLLMKIGSVLPQPTYNNGLTKESYVNAELEYVGGIDGIYDLTKVNISINNNGKLNIVFYYNFYDYGRVVDFNDIIDMSIQTEEQVRNDVTLSRVILFGVFALGMKKEKRYMQKYLIINYLEDGCEKQIITRGQNAPKVRECYEKLKKEGHWSFAQAR